MKKLRQVILEPSWTGQVGRKDMESTADGEQSMLTMARSSSPNRQAGLRWIEEQKI